MIELDETTLFKIELRLIKRHFPNLKPRPIKIDNDLDAMAQAGEPNMLVNLREHQTKRDVTNSIAHELLHYSLKDEGKPLGHRNLFRTRAKRLMRRDKRLDVLTIIELEQCSQLEGEQWIPHTVEYKKIPLADILADVSKHLGKAKNLAAKALPLDLRIRLFEELKGAEFQFACYRRAIQRGEKHIVSEFWKRRRGPRGKPLPELLTQREALDREIQECHKRLDAGDPAALREIRRLDNRLDSLAEKLRRDYDIDY